VTEVIGCDVAKGTWVAVVLRDGAFARAFVAATLREVAAEPADAIAVDIPIGLPTRGQRAADLAARAFVGPRRNSVFMTPVRAAVLEPDHAKASAINLAATGKGISRQAHALRHMILDAEAARDERVHEAHPEASFCAMAGAPLPHAKTSWNGLHARLALLADQGIELPAAAGEAGRVRPDDLIDAAAVAWTAARIAAGTARRLGEEIFV
jgi:predicted RNase H-like nuclease